MAGNMIGLGLFAVDPAAGSCVGIPTLKLAEYDDQPHAERVELVNEQADAIVERLVYLAAADPRSCVLQVYRAGNGLAQQFPERTWDEWIEAGLFSRERELVEPVLERFAQRSRARVEVYCDWEDRLPPNNHSDRGRATIALQARYLRDLFDHPMVSDVYNFTFVAAEAPVSSWWGPNRSVRCGRASCPQIGYGATLLSFDHQGRIIGRRCADRYFESADPPEKWLWKSVLDDAAALVECAKCGPVRPVLGGQDLCQIETAVIHPRSGRPMGWKLDRLTAAVQGTLLKVAALCGIDRVILFNSLGTLGGRVVNAEAHRLGDVLTSRAIDAAVEYVRASGDTRRADASGGMGVEMRRTEDTLSVGPLTLSYQEFWSMLNEGTPYAD